MTIHVHRKAFQAIKTAALSSRIFIVKKNPTLWNCSLFIRLHFTIGCYDFRRTSRRRFGFHFSRIQVLSADRVHRRCGVHNKFSSLKLKNNWCRQAPIFQRWEECCFVFLLQSEDIFGQPPSCFTGTSLLPFRLFLRPILKFWSIGIRWWGSPGRIIPSDGFWSRMSARRTTAFVHRTHRIGFRMSELFRKIDEERLRRLHILKYATQLWCSWWVSNPNRSPCSLMTLILLQQSHCTFVTILCRTFCQAFVHLAVCVGALICQFASTFCLVEQALRRMPFVTEWSCASSFEVILARQSNHFPTWASASRTSGSRCIFHSAA